MPRPGMYYGWVPPLSSAAAPSFRSMLLTLRRLVVGRSLTLRAAKTELRLTVTEFDPSIELRGMAVGQLGDVHIEARDVSWDGYRFEHATADLHNIHFRAGASSAMVAAPVNLTLSFKAAVIEELLQRAAPPFTVELDGNDVARLRWARHPRWGYVEVGVRLAGAALWCTPLAVVVGRRRWRLPARMPAYPIALPEFPHGAVVTAVSSEPGAVLIRALVPQWQVDMPRARFDEIVQQLGSSRGLVSLT